MSVDRIFQTSRENYHEKTLHIFKSRMSWIHLDYFCQFLLRVSMNFRVALTGIWRFSELITRFCRLALRAEGHHRDPVMEDFGDEGTKTKYFVFKK